MDDESSSAMEVERKENQIFVRNLAYQTTSEDLIGLFEEFGPMKRATIVQQDGVSRGYGFVKFALEEDANSALRALQGRELHGRKMKLEIAVQRGQSTKGTETQTPNQNQRAEVAGRVADEDESDLLGSSGQTAAVENTLNSGNSHLQLIVTGVPSHINKKVFRDAVLKALSFKCKKLVIDLLKPDHPMYTQLCPEQVLPAGRVMLMTAPSRQEVVKLVAFLDNVTIKALGLAAVAESEQKGAAVPKCKLQCRPLKEVTPLAVRKQKCRLILRNLSFQATEENVANRLLKFGPLVEVTIPRIEVEASQSDAAAASGHSVHAKSRFQKKLQDQKVQLKPRGFAFVMFLCEKDASSAVEGSEGLKICNREFALDFCQHKYGYGFANENEEGEKEKAGVVEGEDVVDSNSEEENSDSDDSKDDEDKDEDEDEDDDEASDYSGEEMKVDEEDSDAESEPGSEMEWDGSDSDSDEEDDDDEEDKQDSSAAASKKDKRDSQKSTDVTEKRTVFVRDLAYDADQADVKKVFRQFGLVEFAVIVLDKVTKNSKGSAFVKFQTQEAALKCVESCEQLPGANMATTTSSKNKKNNGPTATEALSNLTLTIRGRPFRVDLAVDRDEAKRLKDDTSAKSGKDKRNLYLANEGLLVDSAVSLKRYGDAQKSNNDMSDADRDKRRRSQNEKKKKLVNPLYFVSPTRLSIRNLKKSVNHSELFNLCYKAAKSGLNNGLVEKKDMEEYLIAQSVPIRQRTPALLAIPKMEGVPQNQLVRKAKVMLDSSKLRGADKTAQSRGYGFVEFKHHAHALACLRELNHNAVYGKEFATQYGAKADKKHNLIVDFSLENFQKVVILNSRIEKRNLSQISPANGKQNNATATDLDDDDDTDVLALDRKRALAENVGSDDDSDGEGVKCDSKENKKTRYEKKLEHAQKRKAKELKRKENKKRKLEQSKDNNTNSSADVRISSHDDNANNNKKMKTGSTRGDNSKAWGGFKRHRAKSKGN